MQQLRRLGRKDWRLLCALGVLAAGGCQPDPIALQLKAEVAQLKQTVAAQGQAITVLRGLDAVRGEPAGDRQEGAHPRRLTAQPPSAAGGRPVARERPAEAGRYVSAELWSVCGPPGDWPT